MAHDPCMFCGFHPCKCNEKKKTSGIKRKSLPKSEPVAKVNKPVQPARAPLKHETEELDPELQKVLQTFNYLDMLHPDEVKKYERYLSVPETTGRLVKYERENGETESGPREDGGGT